MRQVAALPMVETKEGPLVLLITTRGRGRWTIPKGWPEKGLSDPNLAAKEGFEEAGVEAEVSTKPVGRFGYIKQFDFFSWAACAVEVYPLRVRVHRTQWREKGMRKMRWASPKDAAALVTEEPVSAWD